MAFYAIKLDEVLWGCLMVAVTMAIHGTGTFARLRLVDAVQEHYSPLACFFLAQDFQETQLRKRRRRREQQAGGGVKPVRDAG